MIKIALNKRLINFPIIISVFFSIYIFSDSFENNSYNNHGVVGLINIPTARVFEEAVHGITIYDGTPDQKITLTSNPYEWMEASFFYTNIQGVPYPGFEYQDYKDKGFNLKLRIKQEGRLPAIAVGFYDFAGTGLYSSEYIVGSYGINNIDLHAGIGWGRLNGSSRNFKNPFTYINNGFEDRPQGIDNKGGQLNTSKFFSGSSASPFFGLSYKFKNNYLFKIEYDSLKENNGTNLTYEERKTNFSYGLDYSFKKNFILGLAFERGNYLSLKFTYKNNPQKSLKKYDYKQIEQDADDNKYQKLIKNLEKNGIGVEKISENTRSIGIELTQFIHPDIRVVEQIITQASIESGIKKNIKKDIKIADLKAINEIDEEFTKNSKLIYEREKVRRVNSSSGLRFRPFLASREEFFKGAFLIENNTEIIFKQNLFFNSNLKYSLVDNFDNLRFPPVNTYPAQVRSDVKEYLKNMDDGLLIGRAQFDYHTTPKKNHHFMLTAGIFEDMFSGYGVEYLYFKNNNNFAVGAELFHAKKRDYEWGFGHLDYKNTMLNGNLYYRNYGRIPFDMKISIGEYLAGDTGATIDLYRNFSNGVKFGFYATFTDVSSEQFGEGSFDKGIYFNIPIYGNLFSYTWKPLTKDPGAKLNRKHTLHDLLVRFKPLE